MYVVEKVEYLFKSTSAALQYPIRLHYDYRNKKEAVIHSLYYDFSISQSTLPVIIHSI